MVADLPDLADLEEGAVVDPSEVRAAAEPAIQACQASAFFLLSGNHRISLKMSRKGLMEQDLSKLDVTKLNPLSPEVISRQATINIGTIGHVAHGKSTVVKAISGVQVHKFTFSFC
ncbi:hypothetical protein KSP40_PGU013762 [Platanthera guangdongensis]|uniref:Uncharacterized protein n=1 Tax=Platanthera guangdongensis TaxID=2320717 RepID=A0ABR2N4V1_9ASPA